MNDFSWMAFAINICLVCILKHVFNIRKYFLLCQLKKKFFCLRSICFPNIIIAMCVSDYDSCSTQTSHHVLSTVFVDITNLYKQHTRRPFH